MSAAPQTPASADDLRGPTGHLGHLGHDCTDHRPPPPGGSTAPAQSPSWWSALPAWTPPLLLAVAGLAACVLMRLWAPGDDGTVLCPFKAATGLDCPGCGMTRAAYALTRADLPAVVDHNVFLLPLAGILGYSYAGWVGRRLGWWTVPELRFSPAAVWITAGLMLAFWLARNLEPFAFLASNAS